MRNPWEWYFDTVRVNYRKKAGHEIPARFLRELKWFVGIAGTCLTVVGISLIVTILVLANG